MIEWISVVATVGSAIATVVIACTAWKGLRFAKDQLRAHRATEAGFLLGLFQQWNHPELTRCRDHFYQLVSDNMKHNDAGRAIRDNKPFRDEFVLNFMPLLYLAGNHKENLGSVLMLLRFFDFAALLVEKNYLTQPDCIALFGSELLDVDQLTRPLFTRHEGTFGQDAFPLDTLMQFSAAWKMADQLRSEVGH